MCCISVHIAQCLKELNIKLQVKNKTVYQLHSTVTACTCKLQVLHSKVRKGKYHPKYKASLSKILVLLLINKCSAKCWMTCQTMLGDFKECETLLHLVNNPLLQEVNEMEDILRNVWFKWPAYGSWRVLMNCKENFGKTMKTLEIGEYHWHNPFPAVRTPNPLRTSQRCSHWLSALHCWRGLPS